MTNQNPCLNQVIEILIQVTVTYRGKIPLPWNDQSQWRKKDMIQIQIPVLHVEDMIPIQMPAHLEESAMIQTLIQVHLEEREKTLI